MTSPVFETQRDSRRNSVREIDCDLVDFARVIPHNALAILKRPAERRRVKGNRGLGAQMRANKGERSEKSRPDFGIHNSSLPNGTLSAQHSFRAILAIGTSLQQTVRHSPIQSGRPDGPNQAHSGVSGPKPQSTRDKFVRLSRVVWVRNPAPG
jgi:hypothetical protein